MVSQGAGQGLWWPGKACQLAAGLRLACRLRQRRALDLELVDVASEGGIRMIDPLTFAL